MKKLLEDRLLKNVVGGSHGQSGFVELLAESNSGMDLPNVIPGGPCTDCYPV